uniref:Mos1 transposase HTH domain-containing protein n=1 Tax=Anopheles farauti TaxID=69004 RepID=A0A182QRK4_9DIPT
MSDDPPSKHHLREVMCFLYRAGKKAAAAHRMIVDTYGEDSLSERTVRKWYVRFRSGNFRTDDLQRPGVEKKFEDETLMELLEHDACQTQQQLANALSVTQQAVSLRLEKLGFIYQQGKWVRSDHTTRKRKLSARNSTGSDSPSQHPIADEHDTAPRKMKHRRKEYDD